MITAKAFQREEDIKLDSEDEFLQQREVIRLDQSKSRFSDRDEYLSKEGVFDIDGLDSDEDNLDDQDEKVLEKAQQHVNRGQQVEESDESKRKTLGVKKEAGAEAEANIMMPTISKEPGDLQRVW
ncbi:hypothetical protein HDU97_002635 [Phlyctochytrium planicorne]|nr:hypothetical protein HDU97_002635 [Phlyctochytrium planicorne]